MKLLLIALTLSSSLAMAFDDYNSSNTGTSGVRYGLEIQSVNSNPYQQSQPQQRCTTVYRRLLNGNVEAQTVCN